MTTLPGYDHPVAQRHTESLAARSVDVESDLDRRYLRSTTLWGRSNAAKTWKWFERIGEIRFGTGRSARIAGFATFFVEYFNDDGVWEKVEADHPAFPEGRRVRSPNGGSRGLVERFYTLMKVPGDAYLIADEDDKDGYHFIGAEEIDPGDAVSASDAFERGVTWITAWEMGSDDVLRQGISPGNFLGRVWSPSKRFFAQVDSPLLAMQTECEVLYLLTQLMKSRLKSRFALNGIFYIPDSINEVNVATIDGEPKREKILSYLARAMTLNVQHFDKPEASVPIFLRGPGEAGEQIKLIRQDESIAETDLKLRGELIERILDGLDVQKKATGGQNDSTNHWERWCATPDTEILTVDGWKSHDALKVGDIALTLNFDTGESEWQPVSDIGRFDVVNEPMRTLKSGTHSSMTTLEHRWPVMQRSTEGGVDGRYPRWKTSAELNTGSGLIASARCSDVADVAKWDDQLVEAVAWAWTEGHIQYRAGRRPRLFITQSHEANPDLVARIRGTLNHLFGPPLDYPMPGRWKRTDDPQWRERVDGDCTQFRLNTAATEVVEQHCPNRVVRLDFIRQMTFAQLDLFIHVSMLADGHYDPSGGGVISQSDPDRIAPIEYAAILAGRRVRRYVEPPTGFGSSDRHCLHVGVSGPIVDFQHGGIGTDTYSGVVWCPTTPNGTWFARRDGTVYFTGNSISDEERRTTVQPDIEMLCSTWDQLVLHPRLRRRHSGVKNSEVHRYRMWFSLTAASIKSNQAEDGRQLADRLAIGEKALREIHNVPESMKPTPEERIRGVGLKMSLPRLALYGVEGVDDIPDSWLIPSKAPGPNSDSPADPTPAGPGKGQPGSPDDKDSDGPKRSKPA